MQMQVCICVCVCERAYILIYIHIQRPQSYTRSVVDLIVLSPWSRHSRNYFQIIGLERLIKALAIDKCVLAHYFVVFHDSQT